MRFYDVNGGRILLDGKDIRKYKMRDVVRAAGLVSQDIFLFHGTVKENIRYGTFDAADEEVEEVPRLAEAHDFIMALPEGYDTVVGERGQQPAGGQRPTIPLAEAILKHPPSLILDEAPYAADNETEAARQKPHYKMTQDQTKPEQGH